MVVDCLSLGALTPYAQGWESVVKVRLLHARVRRKLLARGHDVAVHGVPINQQDMAFTCLSFSVVVLLGLERMGITVTADEQAAYLHLWCVHQLSIIHCSYPEESVKRHMALCCTRHLQL